jgi:single stranded DNA-binding protein (ssb)
MINRVVLVGRLTKDPVLRKTQSNTSVSSFTCAVTRRFQNQDQQADFINCVAWNRTADFISQYGKKGALVGIEGRIQTRNYDDAAGKRVYVTEVVCDSIQLLESKAVNESRMSGEMNIPNEPQMDYYADQEEYVEEMGSPSLDISSDDLPF